MWTYLSNPGMMQLLAELPAQLLQGDEGSHMCDTWASGQGPHAAAGPGAEPHSEKGQPVRQSTLPFLSFYRVSGDVSPLSAEVQTTWTVYTKGKRKLCFGWTTYLRVETDIAWTETHYYTCPVRPAGGAPTHTHTQLKCSYSDDNNHKSILFFSRRPLYFLFERLLPLLAGQRYTDAAAHTLSVVTTQTQTGFQLFHELPSGSQWTLQMKPGNEGFIWIRWEKHLKHAGQGVCRTKREKGWTYDFIVLKTLVLRYSVSIFSCCNNLTLTLHQYWELQSKPQPRSSLPCRCHLSATSL